MSGVFSAPEYFVFILTAQAEESERTRAVTPCVWAPFLQEMSWGLEFWHPMRLPFVGEVLPGEIIHAGRFCKLFV